MFSFFYIVLLVVKGADINRSYLEANKSDLSMGDLSNWLHTRRPTDSMRNQRVSVFLPSFLVLLSLIFLLNQSKPFSLSLFFFANIFNLEFNCVNQ